MFPFGFVGMNTVVIYNRCTETSSAIETESLSRARGEGLKFILARWLHQAPALSV